jgi:hypothetical protein
MESGDTGLMMLSVCVASIAACFPAIDLSMIFRDVQMEKAAAGREQRAAGAPVDESAHPKRRTLRLFAVDRYDTSVFF